MIEWIKCRERYPVNPKGPLDALEYLVSDGKIVEISGYYQDEFYTDPDYNDLRNYTITCWAELPYPPKDEDD